MKTKEIIFLILVKLVKLKDDEVEAITGEMIYHNYDERLIHVFLLVNKYGYLILIKHPIFIN